MSKYARLLAVTLALLGLTVGVIACATGELGITNFNSVTLSDDLIVGDDMTVTDDATVSGELSVTGDFDLTGGLTVADVLTATGGIVGAAEVQNLFVPTYATASFTYTAAAGGTVPLFTIGAGEEWLVHDVRVEVTTNFDATGDDATLVIGDGGDPDGFCVLADAELQAADTEGTGWSAGWQCQVAATRGVYIDGTGGFLYDEASAETIDAVIDEASGETLAGGAATVHIWYTRIR